MLNGNEYASQVRFPLVKIVGTKILYDLYLMNLLSKFHRFLSAEFQILNFCKILPVGIIEISMRKIKSLNYLNFADLVHVQLPSNKALNSVKISFVGIVYYD